MSVYDTQEERGIPRYEANREPWDMNGLYWTCEDCGGRLRPGYRQGFRYLEEKTPVPLRKTAWEQLLLFGRILCRSCCMEEIDQRRIKDPDIIRLILP